MKVIGLISGGKDSFYSLVKCVEYGHEIVALANLHPPPGAADEIDSWMYQTVGHSIIDAYSSCFLGAPPLIRSQILASPSSSTSTSLDDDPEVSSLRVLLEKVLAVVPDADAVSSGAILSSYQRERVEYVCQQLGLTSLAYLWQRDQAELLEEMVAAGMSAILVKVAAMNLARRDLVSLRPLDGTDVARFCRWRDQFGFHVCGEGGEYETLTLDCPLFHSSIEITQYDVVTHSNDAFAPVLYLRPLQFRLVPKTALHQQSIPSSQSSSSQAVSSQSSSSQAASSQASPSQSSSSQAPLSPVDLLPSSQTLSSQLSLDRSSSSAGQATADASLSLSSVVLESPVSFSAVGGAQMSHELELSLEEVAAGPPPALLLLRERVFFLQVFVRSLDQFAAVNRYCVQWFGVVRPPARACVELDWLACDVRIEYYVAPPSERDGAAVHHLHVQSLSCWAPACIGPYSQATYLPAWQLVFLAGQIALDPPSHTLKHRGDVVEQARLIGRHLQAILACLPHVAEPVALDQVLVWNVYLVHATPSIQRAVRAALSIEDEALVRWFRVSSLPRSADVEVQIVASATGLTRRSKTQRGNGLLICTVGSAETTAPADSGQLLSLVDFDGSTARVRLLFESQQQ